MLEKPCETAVSATERAICTGEECSKDAFSCVEPSKGQNEPFSDGRTRVTALLLVGLILLAQIRALIREMKALNRPIEIPDYQKVN